MPQIKALVKTVESLTDMVLADKLAGIFVPMRKPGIERVLALLAKLADGGAPGPQPLEWSKLDTEDDREFMDDFFVKMLPIFDTLQTIPPARKADIWSKVRAQLSGGGYGHH